MKQPKVVVDMRATWVTKLFCLTSLTFFSPALLQFCWALNDNVAYLISALCIVTGCISIAYWQNAKPSFRLDLDNFFAKFASVILCIVALYFGHDYDSLYIASSLSLVILSLYILSIIFFSNESFLWLPCHGIMHMCVGAGMGVVQWSTHRSSILLEQMEVCHLQPLDSIFQSIGSVMRSSSQ